MTLDKIFRIIRYNFLSKGNLASLKFTFYAEMLKSMQAKNSNTQNHNGIIIQDPFNLLVQDSSFIPLIKDSIDYIDSVDQRRSRIVKAYLKNIWPGKLPYPAVCKYYHANRLCIVDPIKIMKFKSIVKYGAEISGMASRLVHESTHGYIDDKYIPYTKTSKHRIERLCVKESIRFLEKTSGNEFWIVYWNTLLQHYEDKEQFDDAQPPH